MHNITSSFCFRYRNKFLLSYGLGSFKSDIAILYNRYRFRINFSRLSLFSKRYIYVYLCPRLLIAIYCHSLCQSLSQNFHRTSQNFHRTFAELSQNFHRTFAELSQKSRITFTELSQNFRRTFTELSQNWAHATIVATI